MKNLFVILVMALAFVSCVDEKTTEKEVILTPPHEEVYEVEAETEGTSVEVEADINVSDSI